MTWIPYSLIVFRFVAGLVVLLCSIFPFDGAWVVIPALIVLGVLSDIFDGIAARRLKISTIRLRVWDSRVDVTFFVFIVVGLFLRFEELRTALVVLFSILGILELSVHAISWIRFRKESSTHHYLSKFFGVCLFSLLIQLNIVPQINVLYFSVIAVGILSYVESGLIMLKIKEWRCDIRTIFDVEKNGW